jgi:hypothetical protein
MTMNVPINLCLEELLPRQTIRDSPVICIYIYISTYITSTKDLALLLHRSDLQLIDPCTGKCRPSANSYEQLYVDPGPSILATC